VAKKDKKSLSKKDDILLTGQSIEQILDRLSPFVNLASEVFGLLDENLNILFINAAGEKMLGVSNEAIRGKNLTEIVPDIVESGRYDKYLNVLKRGESYFVDDLVSHTKFGDVHLNLKAFKVGNRLGVIATDITPRKLMEAKLARVGRALLVTSSSNVALVRATDESEYLQEVCRIAVKIGGYRLAWVGFAEKNAGKTVRPVAYAGYEEGYLEKLNITWADTERGRGPTGTAIRSGAPGVARYILTDPNFEPWRAEALKRGYASSIALPLKSNGLPVGALNVYAAEPDAFDEGELGVLREMANDLAHGIVVLRMRAEQKRMNEALKESEQKYRAIIDLAPDCIITADQNGSITSINPAFTKLMGFAEDEIVGKHFSELPVFRAVDIPRYTEMFISSKTREVPPEPFEFIWVHKDGSLHWGEIHTSLMYLSGELVGSQLIARDITERKAMEEALRESEEKLRNFFDNAEVGLFRSRINDGRILDCNDLLARQFGYDSRDQCIAEHFASEHYVDPDVRKRILAQMSKSGGVGNFEVQVTRRDGSPFWISYSARIYPERGYIEGALVDITERKQVEQTLRERMRFETLLSELSAAFINIPSDKIGQGIVGWLQRVVEFLDVDRSTVLELSEDGTKLNPTLHYSSPGMEPIPSMAIDEIFPWYTEKIRRGETMILGNTDDLPEDAQNEKAYAVSIGMKSNLTIPLHVGGRVMGAIAFGVFHRERTWDEELVSRLRLVGEIFANALLRKRTEEELRKNEQTIRELAQEAAQAHERERERLALEVHDRISQTLTAIFYQLKTLECYPSQDAAAQQALLRASALMKECIGESRNIMEELYSPVLSDFGIVAVMEDELRRFREDTGCEAKLNAVCPVRPPPEVEFNIYRIFREALANIRKHATGAKNVKVSLVCKDGLANFMVYDDGCGFDIETALLSKHMGGVAGMRRRAEIAGGTFNIESGAGKGTTVFVTLPYKPAPKVEQETT